MGLVSWNGDQILRKYREAERKGINTTMSEVSIDARLNHPGWSNQTGKAEGSIQPIQNAKPEGKGFFGLWGSKNVVYFIWLELKHGGALRTAAAKGYTNLAANIKKHLKGKPIR